jgi:hypothetical protein
MHSVCVTELHVTVTYTKIMSTAQQHFLLLEPRIVVYSYDVEQQNAPLLNLI